MNENIDAYIQINEKLNENFENKTSNDENSKSMEIFNEMSFLKEDIKKILNNDDINKKFKKIMSIYNKMNNQTTSDIDITETQTKKSSQNSNEITLKIKIEQNELNNTIYFLDNTNSEYRENDKWEEHKHDNLCEINENNTTLIIDEKIVPFAKYFIPTKTGIYSIKLLFKNNLSNCAYMFCNCENITEIDFSKFNTQNVNDMKYMFYNCSSLTSLNLSSFKTENVTDMKFMFYFCSSLITLNLSTFNTENVTDMQQMFRGCSNLQTLNLESFKTEKVICMSYMFYNCESLISLDLKSFNTQNVNNMFDMFYNCFSLKTLNLSSFNADKAFIGKIFYGCRNLLSCNSSDRKILDGFNFKE